MPYTRSTKPGTIYLAYAALNAPVKIGWSTNPDRRKLALGTESPTLGIRYTYQIVSTLSGSRFDEAAIHASLWKYAYFPRCGPRPFNEWYMITTGFLDALRAIGFEIKEWPASAVPSKRKRDKRKSISYITLQESLRYITPHDTVTKVPRHHKIKPFSPKETTVTPTELNKTCEYVQCRKPLIFSGHPGNDSRKRFCDNRCRAKQFWMDNTDHPKCPEAYKRRAGEIAGQAA